MLVAPEPAMLMCIHWVLRALAYLQQAGSYIKHVHSPHHVPCEHVCTHPNKEASNAAWNHWQLQR